jgi:glycosyltransferase involved in cell wall biosynthesis
MRVMMLPFDGANPYQRMLKIELERQGADVRLGQIGYRLPLSQLGLLGGGLDVVHLHWLEQAMLGKGPLRSLLKGALFLGHLAWLRLAGRRIVWTVHNIHPHEVRYPGIDRLLRIATARLAHGLIAHCPAAKKEVIRTFRMGAGQRVHVVPQGNYIGSHENRVSKIEARRALALEQDALVLLFLGNVRPYKGVVEMIQAFKRLDATGTILLIAGAPRTPQDQQAVTEAIGASDRIRFDCGFVPDERVQFYMNAANAAVFPYRNILNSGAVMLAMSFGRACIAPRLGCIAQMLSDQGGFLYGAAEEQGLEKAMRRAIEDRARLTCMGEFNRAAAARLGWDGIAAETMKVYRGVENG